VNLDDESSEGNGTKNSTLLSYLYHYLFLSTVVKICRRQEYLEGHKKKSSPRQSSRVFLPAQV